MSIKQKSIIKFTLATNLLTTTRICHLSICQKNDRGIFFRGAHNFPYNKKIYKYIFLLYVFLERGIPHLTD